MMPLTRQVCSLEPAKRLRELGAKQQSLFWWEDVNDDFHVAPSLHYFKDGQAPKNNSGTYQEGGKWTQNYYAAFTVAELGEMLLPHVFVETYTDPIDGVRVIASGKDKYREYAKTEADARAKILIYLLENKLIEVV